MEKMLVKADYEIAQSNGIGRNTLENRIYNLLWDKEKALTEPITNSPGLWQDYKHISVVTKSTFYRRINKGIDPMVAATTSGSDGRNILKK